MGTLCRPCPPAHAAARLLARSFLMGPAGRAALCEGTASRKLPCCWAAVYAHCSSGRIGILHTPGTASAL